LSGFGRALLAAFDWCIVGSGDKQIVGIAPQTSIRLASLATTSNQFAMGGDENQSIPPEFPNWGTFTQMGDKNQGKKLRQILEAAESAKAAHLPPQIK